MKLRNPESAPFAVDVPAAAAFGIEPGGIFDVADPEVAARLIDQGFEAVEPKSKAKEV